MRQSSRTRAAAAVVQNEQAWTVLMLRVLAAITLITIAVAASACTGGGSGAADRPISAPPGRGS